MSKSLKIFLSVLALISIGFSLAIVFGWNPFAKQKIQPVFQTQTSVSTPTPREWLDLKSTMVNPPSNLTFASPVDKDYFTNADFISAGGFDNNIYMVFFLESEAEIKSIFKGVVLDINHFKHDDPTFPQPNEESDFSQIWIEEENKKFKANYVFIGDVLVEKGANVEAGDTLIKTKEGKLTSRKNSNLSVAIFDGEGNKIFLSKDLFLKN